MSKTERTIKTEERVFLSVSLEDLKTIDAALCSSGLDNMSFSPLYSLTDSVKYQIERLSAWEGKNEND